MSSPHTRRASATPKVGGDVAIVGMAGLFPGAPDLATYWQNIVSKKHAITDPPPEAWDADIFYDPDSTANDRVYCKRGGFLGPLADFDPLAHGVMPLTMQGSEPDQWLALRVARDALTDAGYGEEIPERHRTAVVLGKGTYLNRGNFNVVQHGRVVDQTIEILQTLHPEFTESDLQLLRTDLKSHLPPFDANTVPGLIPNVTVGRIANRLDLMGPSYTVDAACASSLVAIDIAIRELLTHQCDLALVGGVHVVTPVPVLMVFCHLNALSRKEQIRPFDKDADGTILGEGLGMVVLKRREDAERDGHRIYAIIKGSGIASDGRELSVMAPRLEGEVLALQRAYENAGIAPHTIGLIEAHGTGTPVGDVTEVKALTQAFGPRDGLLPSCALGSVKSMIGHLMPAAGIAGLIKAALALYHKVRPPTLNVHERNPHLKLDTTPFYINTETRPWIHNTSTTPRRAGVNAFGFGGINAHIILEEVPENDPASFQSYHQHWDTEVCILSADSRLELMERGQQLQQFLRVQPQMQIKDVAFTLNVPLHPDRARLAIVAASTEDLQRKLDRALRKLAEDDCRWIKDVEGIYYVEQSLLDAGQLAFLFPGEGSQYVNMLSDLCVHFPEVRKRFDFIDDIVAKQGRDYAPSNIIFPPPTLSEAESRAVAERLWQMEGAVEAVLTANLTLFHFLRRLDIHPDVMMGHSTGEYSAMFASGMISLHDDGQMGQFARELNEVHQQAAYTGKIPHAVLVAVGADVATVLAITEQIEGEVHIAMDNCPHQTVIVGNEAVVERTVEQFRRRGLIFERLPFDRPYHTPLFAPFAATLRDVFSRWLQFPPRIPTYSCPTISLFSTDLSRNRDIAVEHWMRPVEFRRTIETMYADGVRIFVEVGPRGNLSSFVDDTLRGQPHLAIPVDVMQRSGTVQLNHLVGMLGAQGVPMRLDYLYARRSPRKLNLDQPDDLQGQSQQANDRVKLPTGWPSMHLSEETAARLRAGIRTTSTPSPASGIERMPEVKQPAISQSRSQTRPADADRVLSAHLQTMEQFLSLQQEVMQTFLTGRTAVPPPSVPAALPVENIATDVMLASSPTQLPSLPVRHGTAEGKVNLEPVAVSESPPVSSKTIGDRLLQLVSERTGYPVEMLDLNLDLEAELGVDSIKRVEILGVFQQQTGLLQAEDAMESLTNCKTLQEVINFLSTRGENLREPEPSVGPNSHSPTYTATQSTPSLPFVGTIVSLTPGEALVARYEINLDEDLFLQDHTLGRQVAITDPELRGLPVMPLTMSMEMMAEAAAILMPGKHLVGMRELRAYRWIALEAKRLALEIVAQRNPSELNHEISVRIHEAAMPGSQSPGTPPIVEGTMVFAESYPEPPTTGEFILQQERDSKWTPEQLYQEVMFHGPAFRGTMSIDRCGEDGAQATLQKRSVNNLLRSNSNPSFLTDPVLLDQPGQVVGFWTAQHLETGYVIFPFHLEALHLYGSNLSVSERVTCRARIDLIEEQHVRSDLDIVLPDGRIWAQLVGWEDRRFDLPDAFFRGLLAPQDMVLSEPCPVPSTTLPEANTRRARQLNLSAFPDGFFIAHGGIWLRVLAYLVLGRLERESWSGPGLSEEQRIEWLLGRVVAKEAVRLYLKLRYGIVLYSADIDILLDENGNLLPQGAWSNNVPHVPVLSLSHSCGSAIAVVGDGDGAA